MARVAPRLTLLEAAILLAIGTILASIGLPVYQTFNVRAQVSAGIEDMRGVQAAVQDAFLQTGRIPENRRSANLPPATNSTQSEFVRAVDIGRGGTIQLVFGNQADTRIAGRILRLTPRALQDRTLVWRCDDGSLDKRYLPMLCGKGS